MTEHPGKQHHVQSSLNDKHKIIKSFERGPKPTLKPLHYMFSTGKSTVGDITMKRQVYKAESLSLFNGEWKILLSMQTPENWTPLKTRHFTRSVDN